MALCSDKGFARSKLRVDATDSAGLQCDDGCATTQSPASFGVLVLRGYTEAMRADADPSAEGKRGARA